MPKRSRSDSNKSHRCRFSRYTAGFVATAVCILLTMTTTGPSGWNYRPEHGVSGWPAQSLFVQDDGIVSVGTTQSHDVANSGNQFELELPEICIIEVAIAEKITDVKIRIDGVVHTGMQTPITLPRVGSTTIRAAYRPIVVCFAVTSPSSASLYASVSVVKTATPETVVATCHIGHVEWSTHEYAAVAVPPLAKSQFDLDKLMTELQPMKQLAARINKIVEKYEVIKSIPTASRWESLKKWFDGETEKLKQDATKKYNAVVEELKLDQYKFIDRAAVAASGSTSQTNKTCVPDEQLRVRLYNQVGVLVWSATFESAGPTYATSECDEFTTFVKDTMYYASVESTEKKGFAIERFSQNNTIQDPIILQTGKLTAKADVKDAVSVEWPALLPREHKLVVQMEDVGSSWNARRKQLSETLQQWATGRDTMKFGIRLYRIHEDVVAGAVALPIKVENFAKYEPAALDANEWLVRPHALSGVAPANVDAMSATDPRGVCTHARAQDAFAEVVVFESVLKFKRYDAQLAVDDLALDLLRSPTVSAIECIERGLDFLETCLLPAIKHQTAFGMRPVCNDPAFFSPAGAVAKLILRSSGVWETHYGADHGVGDGARKRDMFVTSSVTHTAVARLVRALRSLVGEYVGKRARSVIQLPYVPIQAFWTTHPRIAPRDCKPTDGIPIIMLASALARTSINAKNDASLVSPTWSQMAATATALWRVFNAIKDDNTHKTAIRAVLWSRAGAFCVADDRFKKKLLEIIDMVDDDSVSADQTLHMQMMKPNTERWRQYLHTAVHQDAWRSRVLGAELMGRDALLPRQEDDVGTRHRFLVPPGSPAHPEETPSLNPSFSEMPVWLASCVENKMQGERFGELQIKIVAVSSKEIDNAPPAACLLDCVKQKDKVLEVRFIAADPAVSYELKNSVESSVMFSASVKNVLNDWDHHENVIKTQHLIETARCIMWNAERLVQIAMLAYALDVKYVVLASESPILRLAAAAANGATDAAVCRLLPAIHTSGDPATCISDKLVRVMPLAEAALALATRVYV